MSVEASVEESADEGLRPCDYCGHPVVIDSVDEYDCPAYGEPDEDQPVAAGRGS